MARLLLPVAISLAALIPVSIILALAFRRDEGKIALSKAADENEHDPFEVITPEDVIDGDPIDETGFLHSVRSILCWLFMAC
jgi:hypothetical protein